MLADEKITFDLKKNKRKWFLIAVASALLFFLVLVTNAVSETANTVQLTTNAGVAAIQLSWSTTVTPAEEFKIYRSASPGVTPTVENYVASVVGQVIYDDTQVTGGTTYYYLVAAISSGQEYLSNEASAIAFPLDPHGYYIDNNVTCALCHQGHKGFASKLLADIGTKEVCYQCHGTNGVSIYKIEPEFSRTGSAHKNFATGTVMTCTNCHNPHNGGKDSAGNQIIISKLLEAKINGQVKHTNGGEGFCYACHQAKTSYYPNEGSGHNSAGLHEEAQISCLACHENHASGLDRLLRSNPLGGEMQVTGVNYTACITCHRYSLHTTPDNAWDGEAALDGSNGKNQCFRCHNPHGTALDANVPPGMNKKYLNYSYDVAYSTDRTKAFNETDYSTCFQAGCHSSTDLLGTNSNFKDLAKGVNLHQKHLAGLANWGYGNAVCKECHRPHGAIGAENPSRRARVGFPAQSVSPRFDGSISQGPLYSSNAAGFGSCTLTCHGVTHVDSEPSLGEVLSNYGN